MMLKPSIFPASSVLFPHLFRFLPFISLGAQQWIFVIHQLLSFHSLSVTGLLFSASFASKLPSLTRQPFLIPPAHLVSSPISSPQTPFYHKVANLRNTDTYSSISCSAPFLLLDGIQSSASRLYSRFLRDPIPNICLTWPDEKLP